jgi:hypothetical protein
LDKYESKYSCELFCLPSISIVFGISGTKLKAALKQASAEKFTYVKCEHQNKYSYTKKIYLSWLYLGPGIDLKERLAQIANTTEDACEPNLTMV